MADSDSGLGAAKEAGKAAKSDMMATYGIKTKTK